MKKFVIAAALVSATSTAAVAGSYVEPEMDPLQVVVETETSSSGGFIVPVLLLLLVAAAVAAQN